MVVSMTRSRLPFPPRRGAVLRSSSTTTGSGLGQYTVVPHPLEVLMSQQLFSRYPADVVEHGKFWAHLALLMPPLGGVAVSVSACSISRQHCTGDQWPECRAGSAISCRYAVFAAGLRRAYRGAAWRDDARGVGCAERDATACPHDCLACGRGPAIVRISRCRLLHAARSSARHLGVGRVLAWNDNAGRVLAQRDARATTRQCGACAPARCARHIRAWHHCHLPGDAPRESPYIYPRA